MVSYLSNFTGKEMIDELKNIIKYDEIITLIKNIDKTCEWMEITLKINNGYDANHIGTFKADDELYKVIDKYYSNKISECLTKLR